MSYCRWSSDDFASDVYVYESAYGFEIHVACNRVHPKEPMPEPLEYPGPDALVSEVEAWADRMLKRQNKVREIVKSADRQEIGGPHDGKSFRMGTPGEAADVLRMLRENGYHVPDHAIVALDQEQTEMNNG